MKDLGIKLHFLLRNEGNWKEFGSEIFTNKSQLKIADIESRFISKLIDSTFFYPDDFGVKKFHVSQFEATSEWYEFEYFKEIPLNDCDNEPIRDIESLLNFSHTILI